MTDIIGVDGKEIKSERKGIQEEGLLLLEKVHEDIKNVEPKEFDSLTVLVKIKGKYLKYSIGIVDALLDVGQLEAIKHDILKKMHS
jgi:hypothetical protein|tara:strand:+ start:2082 stop:2339 length:258 start_codon:yes stop_codon:yes gene_type:complete